MLRRFDQNKAEALTYGLDRGQLEIAGSGQEFPDLGKVSFPGQLRNGVCGQSSARCGLAYRLTDRSCGFIRFGPRFAWLAHESFRLCPGSAWPVR